MKTQIPKPYYLPATRRVRKSLTRLLVSSLIGAAVPTALAANWAWDTAPGSGNFSDANWTSGTIPGAGAGTPASADSLYFGASSQQLLTNDVSGFTFNGLNFNSDASAFTIGGNAITLGGNIVNSSANLQTINLNLALNAGRVVTTAAGGGDITLGGNISGGFALTNNGTGTLTLSGANTYTNSTIVYGGTLNYSGSLNAAGATFDSDGRVNVSGTLNVNQLWIGDQTGGAGAVYQTGGSITLNQAAGSDNLRIGSGTNGYGYLNISGGTLAVNQGVVAARGTRDNTVGVLDYSGGTLNASILVVGTGINRARAVANISGGTVNFTTGGSGALYLLNLGANAAGSGFTSILNLGNGAGPAQVVGPSTTTASRGVIFANSSVTNSLVVANLLSNGTLTVSGVTAANAASTNLFNFNGGTLKATALNVGASFLTSANLSGVYVYGNGGTIDNSGTAITISRPLLAPTGNGIGGIASFTGGAGYIGAPFVAVSRGSGDTTGFGATAIAQIDSSVGGATSGQVTNVLITNPGNRYTATPTFTLTGGGATTPATITGAAPTANTSGGLTFIGSGTTTLSGASTYTGATTVNAGTLALSGSGSLANSSAVILAGGATLNLSGLSSTFVLGANQTLSNGSPTARLIGNFNASTGKVSLTYAGGPAALAITNGTFTLSASTFVTINNAGAQLQPGDYVVIAKTATGNAGLVAGTVPASVIVGGAGAVSPASLQITNNELHLIVSETSSVTALASSANPAGFLDGVYFTASIGTNGIPDITATGTVQFVANGIPFSTNNVVAGSATSANLNTLPRGTTDLITAIYSGDGNFPAGTNSLFQSITNHPPVAGNVSYPRDATLGSLSISIGDLLTHVADADGDTISLVSVGVSSQGITLINSSGSLLYNNPKAATDQFTYTVTDGFGGTSTALVNIVLTNSVTTLALSSSSQTNGYLAGLTFTATVQTNSVTAGDATGTGVFFANGIPFSTNAISGGSAVSASINSLPRGASLITAVYSGDVNYPAVTNTLTQTVTNHPPVASNASYPRVAGQSTLSIRISDLLNAATDQDGDSVSLAGVGVSTRGITVGNDGNFLLYNNPNNVNDQFTYTVSDGFGGTNSATVNIARYLDPKQAGHHNILLLIGDDIGIENLSIYNTNAAASIPYTPNLTALGQSGVAFTHFYARPSCSVSRASIITGRDAFRTGIGVAIEYPGNTGSYHALRTNEYTLPRAFATNAPEYALASVGKFHLGLSADLNSPWTIGGWTNFVGFLGAATSPSYFNWTEVSNGVSFNSTIYTTSDQVNNATNFIAQQGTNRWFLWLAFNAAHQYRHKPPTNLLTSPQYLALSGTAADISANGRAYYEAMLQALDTEIGRLLKSVDTNDTDIIFIGDNGTEANVQQPPFKVASVPATTTGDGHGKFTLYEGGSRTPLLITGPDVGSPGRYNDTLVNEPDLWATIQELAGIDVAASLPTNVIVDSVSLLPAIKADVIRPTPFVIEEQFNYSAAADGVTLRNDRFKFIHFYNHVEQFYDLLNDPYEYTNLLASLPLSPIAQSNYNAVKLKLGEYQTFANTNYTRNLLDYPQISGYGFTNGTFSLNAQFTQLSTNGFFPNSNQPYPTRLSLGGTNLNYQVILWRNADLNNALGWTPVATNLVTGITNNFLLSTNGLLTDLNANADHYFYRISPYIP